MNDQDISLEDLTPEEIALLDIEMARSKREQTLDSSEDISIE